MELIIKIIIENHNFANFLRSDIVNLKVSFMLILFSEKNCSTLSPTIENPITQLPLNCLLYFFPAPKPVGRRARKPGIDRKPRQAYSAKQLDRLESEFKVKKIVKSFDF